MLLADLTLKGLEIAPSQVCGAVRIVPLLRRKVRGDLRLTQRNYIQDLTAVAVENGMYFSYVPHGMVMSWTDDGKPVAQFGGKITQNKSETVQVLNRMAQREAKNELRFLPLHLAMEGFLSMFFSGPNIAWKDYSDYSISYGLGCRSEYSYSGSSISALEDALRVFEIHERQVGVLIFVAEAFASAFVVPTPEDYRAMHDSLLKDFYGELIYQYALLYDTTYPIDLTIDESKISNLADLRSAIVKMRSDWSSYQAWMANGLLNKKFNSQLVYTAGSFTLQRFMTNLELYDESHIGEAILRENGELEYLHTYRLSAAQTRRVYYLSKLAEHNWNVKETAKSLGYCKTGFINLMEAQGFGYLFRGKRK